MSENVFETMEVVHMTAKESEFKGHPMLTMDDGAGHEVSLGITKLRAVMTNIPDVQAFLAKHSTAKADTSKAPKVIF